MYGQNPSAADQRDAMQVLRDAGVATVSISFSGGNDEGGANGIDYLDAAGNKVDGIPASNAYQNQEWNAETRTWGPTAWTVPNPWVAGQPYTTRPATNDEVKFAKIAAVLEAPIYAEYGSFAGEFYVDGTCTWDVATGRSEMHGSYESRSWSEF